MRESERSPEKRCEGCGRSLMAGALTANHEVCPSCDYHHPLEPNAFRKLLLDEESFEPWDTDLEPTDPLSFFDTQSYPDRIALTRNKTGSREAVETGRGYLSGRPIAYGAFVFAFMGGSMGAVVGEKITRLFERAAALDLPVVLLSRSGGARMQEGILSLMQLAKTLGARERLREQNVPFFSVLLHPTTGGVAASFGLRGDVNIAEPNALIGFAGPRVIENTLKETPPSDFQRSEFLMDHGMLDLIVHRRNLKATLSTLVRHLGHPKPREA